MDVLFYGKDVEDCLRDAAQELNIKKEELNYKVLKKSGFFNKVTTIKVKLSSKAKLEGNVETEENIGSKEKLEIEDTILETDDELMDLMEEVESSIFVRDGQIVVLQNEEDKEQLMIRTCKGINLYINGVLCDRGKNYNVTQKDEIKYIESKIKPSKSLDIRVSEDNMSVYCKVSYERGAVYKLRDSVPNKYLNLRAYKVYEEDYEKYEVKDISKKLYDMKIYCDILYDKMVDICSGTIKEETLIAKGKLPIDDTEDEIKLYFNTKEKIDTSEFEDNAKVDYKKVRSFSNVIKGDLIGEMIRGKQGSDGVDVFGKTVKRKVIRSKRIKAGKGCEIKEGKVYATKEGRAQVQDNVFTVNSLLEIEKVDMKSGNIKFAGDIEISKSITDGMEVNCRGNLTVGHSITSARVKSNGDVIVRKNVINSILLVGGYDLEKKMYIDLIKEYYEDIEDLIIGLEKMILKAHNRSVGELIRILIEKRYKKLPQMSLEILSYNITNGIQNSDIVQYLREKIKGYKLYNKIELNELYSFKEMLKEEIEYLGDSCEISTNVITDYVQNSTITCTGNLKITGSGSYISKLKAIETIEFTNNDSVVRGGVLEAKNKIILKNVGSKLGVVTNLCVEEDGVIEADLAYAGTIFSFGRKKKILIDSARKVKAYLDKENRIQIDKLKV